MRNKREDITFDASSLYTYEKMRRDLYMFEACFPHMALSTAGISLDGRDIYEVIVGNRDAKRHILIQASIHGREYINTLLAMRQLKSFLEQEEPMNEVCFHILPMTNPDGVTISQRGPGAIRKPKLRSSLQRCCKKDFKSIKAGNEGTVIPESKYEEYWKRWKANARGVDLNRNFDSGWQAFQGTAYASCEQYKGAFPASEPEVQAILKVEAENPVVCTISYHSSGPVIYWDYGSTGDVRLADQSLADFVSKVTGYEKESTILSELDAAGCSDYFVLEKRIPSVTIENGEGECPISYEEFDAIWSANQKLWPLLARYVCEYKG